MNYDARELLLDTVWVSLKKITQVPTYANDHIEQLMIDYAFENGDKTYLEYTNGIPHVAPLVTFNDSKHKHQDFKSTWRSNGTNINRLDHAGDRSQGTGGPVIQAIPE